MSRRTFFLVFAAVALLLAGVVSLFASASPDGLERVAEDQGIARTAQEHPLGDGPLAEYGVGALGDGPLSGGLAGVVGVLAVLALTGLLMLAVRRRDAGSRGR